MTNSVPTMGARVSRFTAAGHGDALETLLEAGAGGRGPEAAPHRPAAHGVQAARRRLGETFEPTVCPWLCGSNWARASGSFVDRGVNVLAFGLALCALGHRLGKPELGTPQPTGWCRPARRQARPGATATTTSTTTFLSGVPAPRGRGVRGALYAHRRTLRPVPGHHVQPGFSQWERATSGHWFRSSWNSTSPGTGFRNRGEPARIIDAGKSS